MERGAGSKTKYGVAAVLALYFLSLPLVAQTSTGGNVVIEGSYLNVNNMSRFSLDAEDNYGLPIPQRFNLRADLNAEVGDVGPLSFRRLQIQLGPQITHQEENFTVTLYSLAGASKHRWGDIVRQDALLFTGGSSTGPMVTLGGKIDTDYELNRFVSVRGMRVDVSPTYYAGRWHREYKVGCDLAFNLTF